MKYENLNVEMMDEAMAEVLRKKSGLERLEIAFGMWECAQEIIQFKVEDDHPDWSEAQVRKEVARRLASGGNSSRKLICCALLSLTCHGTEISKTGSIKYQLLYYLLSERNNKHDKKT